MGINAPDLAMRICVLLAWRVLADVDELVDGVVLTASITPVLSSFQHPVHASCALFAGHVLSCSCSSNHHAFKCGSKSHAATPHLNSMIHAAFN